VTLFIHGFNVSVNEALFDWFPAIFKRLYWTGLPVLAVQDGAYFAGLTWPGDEEGDIIATPAPFYPENEFNALRSGVALSRLLQHLRTPMPGRRVNILAHSLGNMVVHSALQMMPILPSAAPVQFVMSQAAVASEAFLPNDATGDTDAHSELAMHAQAYGMHEDLRWEREWQELFLQRHNCPSGPGTCGPSHYDRWKAQVDPLNSGNSLNVEYARRWRQRRPGGRGSWRGFFAGNLQLPGVAVYNAFSGSDHILRVDQGIGDLGDPHAWFACQRRQKPNVGLGIAAVDYLNGLPMGSKDGPHVQFWAELGGAASLAGLSRQQYLWDDGGSHNSLVRQWAELAYWFPATSAPAGVRRIESLVGGGIDRNIPVDESGSDADSGTSHSFIRVRPFPDVWAAFEDFRRAFVSH
jgi:hypothetical protein